MAAWNDVVYPGLNDGVYRCGFAKSQAAYDEALAALFACRDRMEARLAKSRFLCGDALTLSEVRSASCTASFAMPTQRRCDCESKEATMQTQTTAMLSKRRWMPRSRLFVRRTVDGDVSSDHGRVRGGGGSAAKQAKAN